jgi:alkanesulfonate monooxygenase SsuD/methylene tetrahydromethanopterin reductase-like flavin-dependent oxidoreductase (luciferase family)
MQEAKDYYHHCIVEHADWSAVDRILGMKDITAENTPPDKFQAARNGYAQGMGGLPIVGDPDHVARHLIDLSSAGLTGIGLSFVNYLAELPYFCDEVLPRLERAGVRAKAPPLAAE